MGNSSYKSLFLIVAVVVLGSLVLIYSNTDKDVAVVGSVSIAASKTVSPSTIWIAHDKGFFRELGVDASIKPYSSGKTTTEAMLRKEADLSASAEFLAARMSYKHKELRILGTLAFVHQIQLLGLKERGIESVGDLNSKRIGVKKGTNGEYFLKRLLTLNAVDLNEVQLVDLKPQEMQDALIEKSVDAVLVWPPFVQQIKQHFGDQLMAFDGQPGQDYYYLLLGREDWIASNPVLVERVIQALVKAEKWMQDNPREAAAYLADLMGISIEDMQKILSEYRFSVSLPQSLVIAMESEYNWLEEEKLADKEQRPALLDLIVSAPLKKVDPTQVNILQ